MAKYKVLVTARSFGTADSKALDLLAANDCEVKKLVAADGPIPEQLKKELPEADAVIAGLEDYDEALIACGSKLKVISRYGVGYDKVDVKAAAAHNVAVTIHPRRQRRFRGRYGNGTHAGLRKKRDHHGQRHQGKEPGSSPGTGNVGEDSWCSRRRPDR